LYRLVPDCCRDGYRGRIVMSCVQIRLEKYHIKPVLSMGYFIS